MDLSNHIHQTNDSENDRDTLLENTNNDLLLQISTLPKSKGWYSNFIYNYQGVWLTMNALQGVIAVQKNFKALPSDILLATLPKSGTTWLKALVFSILNRDKFDATSHPLLDHGPHDCVVFLESMMIQKNTYCEPDSEGGSSPRVFATHLPYPCLPESVKASNCKIVYLFRDPKDMLVSSWYFMKKLRAQELPLEEAFEMFIQGISHFGPFWDHLLGYWNAKKYSNKNNNFMIFLSYEALRKEPKIHVKRLAQFLECPFCMEEEKEGVLEEIIRICGFENLSNLEVNKTGAQQFTNFCVENKFFFRKGQVGDSKNHLSDEMIRRLDQLVEEKLSGLGLIFCHEN